MIRIGEIEALMCQGVFSEDILAQFQTALKRVPKAGRCQHCYTTAAQMAQKNEKAALELLQLGLREYCDSWFDAMRSYQNMGRIYENMGIYADALAAYQQAYAAIREDQWESYAPEYAAHMLRAELHCSGFQYTVQLQSYYDVAMQDKSDFARSLAARQFYQNVAEILIFSHEHALDQARAAHQRALVMLQPGWEGPLHKLLLRHQYAESIGATKQAIQFLKSWKG